MSRQIYIGRSGVGKTYLLVQNLLKEFEKNRGKYLLIIVSPTAPLQKLYEPLREKTNMYFPTLDEGITDELDNIVRKNYKSKKGKRKTPIIIIDDLGENTYMKHKQKQNQLNELVVCARHLGAHIVFLFQRIKQATTSVRDNADIIYVFQQENKEQKAMILKEFAGRVPDEVFYRFCERAWRLPYGYVKIDRTDPNKIRYFEKTKEVVLNKRKM
jgi:hypothetical protein